MPQQTLRREHDERLPPVAYHLAAEAVEVLGRRRRRDDLHVVFGGEEQEPFEAGARVLGAFAFECVRQEQHDAAEAAPLVFGAADELIDDHLGGVDEVAVLGFPENEAFGVVERVAVLETHRAGFAERAVDDVDARLSSAR